MLSESRLTAGGGIGFGLSHFEAFFDTFTVVSDVTALSKTLLAEAIE